jgi:hypothetical protein
MALDLTSLSRRDSLGHYLDGAGSVKYEYGYVTGDAEAVVEAAGYFNGATTFLNVGDTIRVVGNLATLPPFTAGYVVVTNVGGVVTVALQV